MTITLAGTTFDHVSYDEVADVLYLHVGDPSTAVQFDASPEGHALRFDSAGELVGLTIVGAKRMLDADGSLSLTLPARIDVPREQLAAALAA